MINVIKVEAFVVLKSFKLSKSVPSVNGTRRYNIPSFSEAIARSHFNAIYPNEATENVDVISHQGF